MFFNWFPTIEIDCDAPDYPIVRACRKLGFQAPEDVRWRRAGAVAPLVKPRQGWRSFKLFKWLSGNSKPTPACSCGQVLPQLETHRFAHLSGRETQLLLGQCRRCRTIYWNEA